MLLTQNVTVVVTVMFPFCDTLLIGLKASDFGDKDGLVNGGFAQRGGGGGGVVFTLFNWVGECCVLVVGKV